MRVRSSAADATDHVRRPSRGAPDAFCHIVRRAPHPIDSQSNSATASGRDAASAPDERLLRTLERSVDDGQRRLGRTWPALVATGTVGGIDVGIGVLALLVVRAETGSALLGALAFGVGFIALTLAQSELFTENFLVPVTTVVARDASVGSLLRLWWVTALANLAGGWIVMALVIGGLPELHATAVRVGSHYPQLGIGWTAFASGVLGGAVITLMTWMERGTRSVPAKLVAAIAVAFVLAAPPLDHAVVGSLEMFGALQVGAPFGYADWAGEAAWAALANLVGGLGLVTMLRLVQVGSGALAAERRRSPHEPRGEADVDAT
jgi:formate/nitrite transporter FocA (FNT family)